MKGEVMTNEEFIQELLDAEYVLPEAVVPHARKLVAVVEAATHYHNRAVKHARVREIPLPGSYSKLIEALAQLEGGEDTSGCKKEPKK